MHVTWRTHYWPHPTNRMKDQGIVEQWPTERLAARTFWSSGTRWRRRGR